MDGSNASSTATVTVTITGENDPPVAADVSATALEHGPAVQVTASYDDPDVGDSHTFAINATGAKGRVADLGNGVFSYDPNGAFASLKAGATETDTFTYTVTDGSNASSTATVTVTITGQNDAPVAANVSATAAEHGPAVQVSASYTDPDVGDSHSFALGTAGTKGTVTDLGNGAFSYDPNGAFASLKVGATATDTFSYTVTDGSNASSSATVTVTITGENDAPVAAKVSATVSAQGPAIQVAASYTDPDVGDSHSFAIDTTGTKGKVTDLGNGVFSYDPNGAFVSLKAGATATDTFTYTVTDGSNASSSATVTVTITGGTGTNHPPVAANVTASVSEDGPPVQIAASYTDPDVSDSHTFSVNTTGTKGNVINLENGVFTYDPNGGFENLAAGTTATDTFRYSVIDGSGASSTATVTMRVVGQNDAPTIVGGKFDGSVAEAADDHDGKGKHEASGLVVFADVDSADRHSVTFAPRGSSYIGTFEPTITRDSTGRATGTVGWTYHVSDKALDFLRAGQTILQTYDIAIADGNGGTAKQAITIKLVGANDAPDAHNDVYLLTRGSTVTVSASNGLLANDTDPDAGDTLQISAVNGISAAVGQTIKLESGALLRVNYDGSFTYIPKNDRNEVDSFTYTIVDASGAKSTAKVILAAVKDHDRRDEHDNPSTSSPGSSSAVGFSGMGTVYSVSGNETNWPDAWFTAAVLTGEATNETNIPTARLSQNVSDECTVTIDIGTCITNFELEVEGREYAWRSDLVTSLKTTPMATANATLRISI
jgi:VCBS repeat-containing protein